MFTSEEPTRFGIGCLGSRLLAGALDRRGRRHAARRDGRIARRGARARPDSRAARSTCALHGRCLRGVRRAAHRAGTAPRTAETATSASSRRSRRRRACGCSSKVRAARGRGADAGSPRRVPRGGRDRARRGSGGALDRIERYGRHRRGLRGVSRARSTACRAGCDSRSTSATSIRARRDSVLAKIRRASDDVAARRGVTVRSEPINADPPALCAQPIVDAIVSACDARAAALSADDQPRVPRLAVHVADCADRHDLHPVPRRRQPSAGRIRVTGRDRPRHCRVGRYARCARGLVVGG